MDPRLEKLCERFEIAVGNFGRSCISMKANEKAFQAWYAASVIQEFGMARVYREVHFWKSEVVAREDAKDLFEFMDGKGEVFPDVSISWEPDVDARHSSTRKPDVLRRAENMVQQFGILSELKVTGSTGLATSYDAVRQDLAKLAAFSRLHQKATEGLNPEDVRGLATYMVILDNHRYDKARVEEERDRTKSLLDRVTLGWPKDLHKPPVLVIRATPGATVVDTYRNFGLGKPVALKTGDSSEQTSPPALS